MHHAIRLATLALASGLLQADGLADLKAALSALPQTAKVRIQLEEESRETEGGKDQLERRSRQVEAGPGGLRILADSRQPSAPGQQKVTPGEADGALQAALHPTVGLLHDLARARVLEEVAGTWEGRPARRLKVALELGLDQEARSHLKRAQREATLWLGPDGLPYAMTERVELQIRVLLVASVRTQVDIQRRFLRTQDRLLVAEERSSVQGSALGKAFSTLETTRCHVLP